MNFLVSVSSLDVVPRYVNGGLRVGCGEEEVGLVFSGKSQIGVVVELVGLVASHHYMMILIHVELHLFPWVYLGAHYVLYFDFLSLAEIQEDIVSVGYFLAEEHLNYLFFFE